MRTLCLDLGNTRMKAALFENGQLLSSHVLENDGVETVEALLREYQPERSILSSVIHHSPEINRMLEEKTQFHLLNHLSKLNFTNNCTKRIW